MNMPPNSAAHSDAHASVVPWKGLCARASSCERYAAWQHNKPMTIRILLTFVGLAMTACASHTGVVARGNDQFMIAKQQATGFPGLGNMKAEIIQEGTQHCVTLGRQFEL